MRCAAKCLEHALIAIPGVGPLTGTLVAADVSDGKGYESSSNYAASLGVAPRPLSCGDR